MNNKKYDDVDRPEHYIYHDDEEVEPIMVITSLGLLFPFCVGSAIKYICRYRSKGGRLDLEKALWYLRKAIEKNPKMSRYNSVQLTSIWDMHPAVGKILSSVMVLELQEAIDQLQLALEHGEF